MAVIIRGAGASLPESAMLKGFLRRQLLGVFVGSVIFVATPAGFLVHFIV